jgi:hypothetical protein
LEQLSQEPLMIGRVGLATVIMALAISGSVMAATGNGIVMMQHWSASDRCAAQAQKLFPDYTPESNAKRDNAMKQCLASGYLPPRQDLNH